jgi:hypothetical protein
MCPKALLRFTAAEGAGDHCEMGNRSLLDQRVFDSRALPAKLPDDQWLLPHAFWLGQPALERKPLGRGAPRHDGKANVGDNVGGCGHQQPAKQRPAFAGLSREPTPGLEPETPSL